MTTSHLLARPIVSVPALGSGMTWSAAPSITSSTRSPNGASRSICSVVAPASSSITGLQYNRASGSGDCRATSRPMVRTVVLALAILGAAGVAQAQSTKEAGEHFERGEKAQAEGRYRDAISSYLQAFAFVPHPNSLYNIAVCYEKLGEWKQSADYFQKYL